MKKKLFIQHPSSLKELNFLPETFVPNETCHGHSPKSAVIPPTIRLTRFFHKYLSVLPCLSGFWYDFTSSQGLVPHDKEFDDDVVVDVVIAVVDVAVVVDVVDVDVVVDVVVDVDVFVGFVDVFVGFVGFVGVVVGVVVVDVVVDVVDVFVGVVDIVDVVGVVFGVVLLVVDVVR